MDDCIYHSTMNERKPTISLQLYFAVLVWSSDVIRVCECVTIEKCIKDKEKAVSETYLTGILTGIAIGIAIIIVPLLGYLVYRKRTHRNSTAQDDEESVSRVDGAVTRRPSICLINGTSEKSNAKAIDRKQNEINCCALDKSFANGREELFLRRSAHGTLKKAIKRSSRWIISRGLKNNVEVQKLKNAPPEETREHEEREFRAKIHTNNKEDELLKNQDQWNSSPVQPRSGYEWPNVDISDSHKMERKEFTKKQATSKHRSYSMDMGTAKSCGVSEQQWKLNIDAMRSARRPRSQTEVGNDFKKRAFMPSKSREFTVEGSRQDNLNWATVYGRRVSSPLSATENPLNTEELMESISDINDTALGQQTEGLPSYYLPTGTVNPVPAFSRRRRKFNSFPRLSKTKGQMKGNLLQKDILGIRHQDETDPVPIPRQRRGTEQLERLRINLERLSRNIEMTSNQ
ncbi:uncharacterized protein LOC135694751 [Rhopilema esculentum]|uniref:uncharacterized protein LOC135694751 n=1 Tax=Rhopilema esculentum TaxID=499914 RepID=UPI0031D50C0B|eukprot:gene4755-21057_t